MAARVHRAAANAAASAAQLIHLSKAKPWPLAALHLRAFASVSQNKPTDLESSVKPSSVPLQPQQPAQSSKDLPPMPDFDALSRRVREAAAAEQPLEPIDPTSHISHITIDHLQQPHIQPHQPKSSEPPKNFLDQLDTESRRHKDQIESAARAHQLEQEELARKPILERHVERILNDKHNMMQRESLIKEATVDGYWKDFKEVAIKGPKLWVAPDKIRAGNYSPVIPNIRDRLMDGTQTDVMEYVRQRRATLVAFFFNAFGEAQVKTFIHPFLTEFKSQSPDIDLLVLNIEEKYVRVPFLYLLKPYIRYRLAPELRSRYMIHCKDIREDRKRAGMVNNVVGWVNLVDSSGRIRWQANGSATDDEIKSMLALTKKLSQMSSQAAPSSASKK